MELASSGKWAAAPYVLGWLFLMSLGFGAIMAGSLTIANRPPAGTCGLTASSNHSCALVEGIEVEAWAPTFSEVTFDGDLGRCAKFVYYPEETEEQCLMKAKSLRESSGHACLLSAETNECRLESICSQETRSRDACLSVIAIVCGALGFLYALFEAMQALRRSWKITETEDTPNEEHDNKEYVESSPSTTSVAVSSSVSDGHAFWVAPQIARPSRFQAEDLDLDAATASRSTATPTDDGASGSSGETETDVDSELGDSAGDSCSRRPGNHLTL